jgi:Domain of unknown function (DUF4276)
VKFVLFVEGYTERNAVPSFLKRWLDPQLNQNVGIQPVRFDGWSEFTRKIANKAKMHLEGPAHTDIVGAIGLLDLYGPTFFPNHLTSVRDRCEWAKKKVESDVNHPKFRMFFAVHEIEAWILSQPQLLPASIGKALSGKIAQPESVNFSEPPAKLLDRLYRTHEGSGYKKIVYGNKLFDDLDPSAAYDKCPYLARMLDEMLTMAKSVL